MMQKTYKVMLGAGALVGLIALGAGLAQADNQGNGFGHKGMHGQMAGQMGGPMGGPGGMGMMGLQIDFAAADANGDGKLTPDEITAWRASLVKSLDANGDGKLSLEEVTAFQVSQASLGIGNHLNAVLLQWNVTPNADGSVTISNLPAARAAIAKKIDTNSDGILSVEEITSFEMARLTPRIQAQASAMVKNGDVDGDGLLSAAELMVRPIPAPAFERMDRNGDGVLTKDELSQLPRQQASFFDDQPDAPPADAGTSGN